MKIYKILTTPLKLFNVLITSILKSIFVDLPKNIKLNYEFAFDVEKRKQIKDRVDVKKKIELMQDQIKRLQRLVYSVFEDPEYTKRDKGKIDLKELRRDVK